MAQHLRSRGGRPELPPEQKRSHALMLRFTPAEHALLAAAAARRSLPLSAYARALIDASGELPPPPSNAPASAEAEQLRRIGVNLNTAVRELLEYGQFEDTVGAVRAAALAVARRLAELAPKPLPGDVPPATPEEAAELEP